MTLIVLAFIPLIIIGGSLQSRLTGRFENKTKQIFEDAGKVKFYLFIQKNSFLILYFQQISIESIQNRRTVASLSVEDHLCTKYFELIDKSYALSFKRSHLLAIITSISNSFIFFCWSALFSTAVYLIDKKIVTFQSVLL